MKRNEVHNDKGKLVVKLFLSCKRSEELKHEALRVLGIGSDCRAALPCLGHGDAWPLEIPWSQMSSALTPLLAGTAVSQGSEEHKAPSCALIVGLAIVLPG